MPRDYDEKRDFIRVEVDCEIHYREVDSNENYVGRVKNLSGRGMMFISEFGIPPETVLEVKVAPQNDLTQPLHAEVRVVRMAKQRHATGYEIGAVIQQVID
ncbi:MAG: PilZ domain-containing protein [Gammaproteobacteria bacterium]|nr:PilZ domain-containing protein [Gammaproteobacteria bacterium]MDH5651367.1 PilZ domain-containing protein [Gammaproteobacteria bacterium]